MFPIPSGRKLSFIEIGKYWSRDKSSFASSEELRITLSKAWWRGELAAENGPSRLNVLHAIYSTCQDFVAFVCKIACNIDPLRGIFASSSDPF